MKQIKEYITEKIKDVEYTSLIFEHLEHNIPITESYLRMGSDSWCELVRSYRILSKNNHLEICESDRMIVENLRTGDKGYIMENGNRKSVTLDLPKLNPNRKKDGKRFIVYRPTDKKDKEGVIKAKVIRFASYDPSGKLDIRNDDPKAWASFKARHKCDLKKDKNTAGWWACFAPQYFGDILKLRGGKSPW